MALMKVGSWSLWVNGVILLPWQYFFLPLWWSQAFPWTLSAVLYSSDQSIFIYVNPSSLPGIQLPKHEPQHPASFAALDMLPSQHVNWGVLVNNDPCGQFSLFCLLRTPCCISLWGSIAPLSPCEEVSELVETSSFMYLFLYPLPYSVLQRLASIFWMSGVFRLPRWLSSKESACNARATGDMGSILVQEDPLKEGAATDSSILAWRIPWTKEPGGPQCIGSQRVRHDWSDLTHMPVFRRCSVEVVLKGWCWEPCIRPGFIVSGGEVFDLGPEMRLDHLELLCSKILFRYNRDRKSFWHRNQKGTKRVPPCKILASALFLLESY